MVVSGLTVAAALWAARRFAQRSGYKITLPKKTLSGDEFPAEDFCARGN
jgi:hypothetical protein